MGRRSLLTPARLDRLAAELGRGLTIEQAAKNAGVTSRSVRRWREQGRHELDGLSVAGRLELALELQRARGVVLDADPWRLTLEAAAANRAELP